MAFGTADILQSFILSVLDGAVDYFVRGPYKYIEKIDGMIKDGNYNLTTLRNMKALGTETKPSKIFPILKHCLVID